jgi:hypothetical protein
MEVCLFSMPKHQRLYTFSNKILEIPPEQQFQLLSGIKNFLNNSHDRFSFLTIRTFCNKNWLFQEISYKNCSKISEKPTQIDFC